MGYLLAITSAVAFAVLGMSYKLSDKYGCDKKQVNFLLFFVGGLVLLVWASLNGKMVPQHNAMPYGILLGVLNVIAVIAFREVMAKGRISISWTVVNLALVIPVVASILIWKEAPHARHFIGMALIVAAIVLIGVDMGRSKE